MVAPAMASSELSGSVTLTKYSILIQIMFRVSTFLLNAFLLRFMTRDKLGLVNVRLTLLYMNVVFLSREAFRRACLGEGKRRLDRDFINLLWLIVPTGLVVAAVLTVVWLRVVAVDRAAFPDYPVAVASFVIASLVELASEPFAIVAQASHFVRLRAVAEGLANLVKCVITVGMVCGLPDSGLLPFCVAQVAFCLTISLTFLLYFLYFFRAGRHKKSDDFPLRSMGDFFPSFRAAGVDGVTGRLVASFWLQCLVKQLLTEGEKFVMTFLDLVSLANQGVFDIVNNLGSLVARCFFLPVEDGTFHLFSQNLVRGLPALKQNEARLAETAAALSTVLTSLSYVGCCFVFFGPAYAFLFLDLFGGDILSGGDGPTLLRWYCGHILLMAWNGVTEGFLQAMMRQAEVARHSTRMMLFSVSFLAAAVVFVRAAGIVGFIWANYVNMALRIAVNLAFMRNFFRDTQHACLWRSVFPDPLVLLGFGAAAGVTHVSEIYLCCAHGWLWRLCHIFIGALSLVGVLGLVLLRHKDLRRLLVDLVRRQLPRRWQ